MLYLLHKVRINGRIPFNTNTDCVPLACDATTASDVSMNCETVGCVGYVRSDNVGYVPSRKLHTHYDGFIGGRTLSAQCHIQALAATRIYGLADVSFTSG